MAVGLNQTCLILRNYFAHHFSGEASLYILSQVFGDDWDKKIKVIFAGDDTTDEDAMKV